MPQTPNGERLGNQDRSWSDRFKKALGWSAVATLIASLGATIAANSPGDRGSQPPKAVFSGSSTSPGKIGYDVLTLGLHDIAPGVHISLPGIREDLISTGTTTVQDPGKFVEIEEGLVLQPVSTSVSVPMQWARKFDRDPAAKESFDDWKQVEQIAQGIKGLVGDGHANIRVSVHGTASDEAITFDDPSGGLNKKNEENIRLAIKRAESGADELSRQLDTAGLGQIPVTVTGGEEVRNEALNAEIANIAKRNNLIPLELMIKHRDGDHALFTKDELDTISALKDDRATIYEIKYEKLVSVTTYVWRDGEMRQVTTEEKAASIVFIPVIIPWLPGRRKGQGEADPLPVEPLPVGPPPVIPPIKPPKRGNGRQIPPKEIGKVRPGHSSVARHNKQPTKLNQGTGWTRGHRKGRGGNGR